MGLRYSGHSWTLPRLVSPESDDPFVPNYSPLAHLTHLLASFRPRSYSTPVFFIFQESRLRTDDIVWSTGVRRQSHFTSNRPVQVFRFSKMVYSLTYTRPPRQSGSSDSLTGTEKERSINDSIKASTTCSMCSGIPEPLGFDRIITGGTCPVSN